MELPRWLVAGFCGDIGWLLQCGNCSATPSTVAEIQILGGRSSRRVATDGRVEVSPREIGSNLHDKSAEADSEPVHSLKKERGGREDQAADEDEDRFDRDVRVCLDAFYDVYDAAAQKAERVPLPQARHGLPSGVLPITKVFTRWGVLVARCLHGLPAGLADVAGMLVSKVKGQRELSGSLWPRMKPSIQSRAKAIVDKAMVLAARVSQEQADSAELHRGVLRVLKFIFGPEYADTLMCLASTASKLCAAQPLLARASLPCKVFGDIHGHLHDMLLLFHAFGAPDEHTTFIFNGDFVDRGDHQLAVVGLLFALKILLPGNVWLVRGNHEDRVMNAKYGFKRHCIDHLAQYGLKAYELIHDVFDQLPVACLAGEHVLVVHGGIGDGRWTLDDLVCVPRPLARDFLNDPAQSWIMNILWSDPVDEHRDGTLGVHPSPRAWLSSKIVTFPWNITKTFCARNGLHLVVRSHQCKPQSAGFELMHDNMLVRVFSARDYEGHDNDGAVLLIDTCERGATPAGTKLRHEVDGRSSRLHSEEQPLRKTSDVQLTLRPQALLSKARSRQ